LQARHTIAVNVFPNPERMRKRIQQKTSQKDARKANALPSWLVTMLKARGYTYLIDSFKKPVPPTIKGRAVYLPTALRVSLQSISISGNNLISLHLKQSPPDVLISPRIEEFDLLEFYKGADIIQRGYSAARSAMPAIQALL